MDRVHGYVKSFNDAKGFGFITPADGSEDVLVHFRAIDSPGFKSLAVGQHVEFEIKATEKGRMAENVRHYYDYD